jgi:HEAT repeat protein
LTREAAAPALPARGEWQVAVAGGAISVDAFEAPRRPLLEALAARAGFALEIAPGELPPLTVRIAAQPLELALPLLVGELQYRADWASESGGHRLAKLVVGGPRQAPLGDASALPHGEVSAALARALQELADEEQPMSEEDALRHVRDADPEARVRAVLALDSEGEGLAALTAAIEDDPDPRVRAAATVGLEDADEFAAVQALVGALDDPHPEVVVEAIDSLEFAGDASVVPALEPLLSHADARVRKAAADAIRLLGD